MGFLNGRVTFTRYRVSGPSPLPFGDDTLDLAEAHAIGRHGAADPTDGVHTGWAGGDHVLDLSFDLAKNVVNDALHLAIRIDTDKIPGSLLRAYTQIETEALAQQNPSGHPTKAQRQEAKEAAKHPRRGRSGGWSLPPAQPLSGPLGRPERPALCRIDQHDRARTTPDTLPRDVRPEPRAGHRGQPGDEPVWPQ